ncbi:unnamed protein product [Linum trigynum]|uniref:Uncharacterized protein n=1 Tax=Linum trigynum TaxID=586398 RepID=A0AAV2G8T9_9ROSI
MKRESKGGHAIIDSQNPHLPRLSSESFLMIHPHIFHLASSLVLTSASLDFLIVASHPFEERNWFKTMFYVEQTKYMKGTSLQRLYVWEIFLLFQEWVWSKAAAYCYH